MRGGLTIKELLPVAVALTAVLIVMWLVLRLSTGAIRRLAQRMEEEDKGHIEEIERWARQLTHFLRRSLEAVAAIAALLILLRGLGVRGFRRLEWEQVTDWLLGPGLRILLVLGGAYVLARILHLLISRLPLFVIPREGPLAEVLEREKRTTTISRLLRMLTTVVVMTIAGLIVLRELGVDITPILTGAGIAGLAVGFGAQHVVRDVISGFFLIVENQVRVGDIAIINGKTGLVEAIRLRTIVLRGQDGTMHVIPNGAINELSNLTKDYSYSVIDVGVAYKEDVDKVMAVLKEVGTELQQDANYAQRILEPLEVLGVDALADSAVVIRIRIKTLPVEQFDIGRELRRRIKKAFDARGIEIPYPHLSVYFGEASKPVAVKMAEELRRQPSHPSPSDPERS